MYQTLDTSSFHLDPAPGRSRQPWISTWAGKRLIVQSFPKKTRTFRRSFKFSMIRNHYLLQRSPGPIKLFPTLFNQVLRPLVLSCREKRALTASPVRKAVLQVRNVFPYSSSRYQAVW